MTSGFYDCLKARAKPVGVSESTVVRFATELGYDGYPKLQKAMQEMIRDKLTSVQRIEVTSSRIGNDDVLNSVLIRILIKSAEPLKKPRTRILKGL